MIRHFTEIVAEPADRNLTTWFTVQDHLGLTNNDYQAWAEKAIASATLLIENYCGRIFSLHSVRDRFFGLENPEELRLGMKPIVAITLLSIDGSEVASIGDINNGVLIDVSGNTHMVNQKQGILSRFSTTSSAGFGATAIVEYTAGYATIPGDLEMCALKIISDDYFARGKDPSLSQMSIPNVGDFTYWVDHNKSVEAQDFKDRLLAYRSFAV